MSQNNEHPEVASALSAILSVKHPAIDCSLSKLGILQDVELYNKDTVIATFVFPFQKIPVKEKLVNSVRNVAAKFGYRFEYIVRYMNETEKKQFLELEKKHWKG